MVMVRLKPETKRNLELLKKEFHASSHDELIGKMIDKVKKKVSMFGADPDLGGWEKDDREHEDRY